MRFKAIEAMLKSTYNTITGSDADLVIIEGDDVYNCYLMPGVNNEGNAEVESLACWRIEKLAKVESDGLVTYKRLYPQGSAAFCFVAAQYSTYEYSYKK